MRATIVVGIGFALLSYVAWEEPKLLILLVIMIAALVVFLFWAMQDHQRQLSGHQEELEWYSEHVKPEPGSEEEPERETIQEP